MHLRIAFSGEECPRAVTGGGLSGFAAENAVKRNKAGAVSDSIERKPHGERFSPRFTHMAGVGEKATVDGGSRCR